MASEEIVQRNEAHETLVTNGRREKDSNIFSKDEPQTLKDKTECRKMNYETKLNGQPPADKWRQMKDGRTENIVRKMEKYSQISDIELGFVPFVTFLSFTNDPLNNHHTRGLEAFGMKFS